MEQVGAPLDNCRGGRWQVAGSHQRNIMCLQGCARTLPVRHGSYGSPERGGSSSPRATCARKQPDEVCGFSGEFIQFSETCFYLTNVHL